MDCEECGKFISDNIDDCYYDGLGDRILCEQCYWELPLDEEE